MSGERDTYLVVVDATPESALAMRFAALRARRVGAGVKLLHVIRPSEFVQWGGVQAAIEAEEADEAANLLETVADEVERLAGERPATLVARGETTAEVLGAVSADQSVRALVLAAAARGAPGPLVEFFSGERAGQLPCLVMIVPGGLDEEGIERLT